MEWEKIAGNYAADKGLISKNINNSFNSITKRSIYPIKKWLQDLNRHFSKQNKQMDSRLMKRFSIPLIIREVKSKLQ